MKIATSTVSLEGFSDQSSNDRRIKNLRESLDCLKKQDVNLFCLPAGYLFSNDSNYINKLADKIFDIANEYKIAIVVGIDIHYKDLSKDWAEDIKNYNLPFFATASIPQNGKKYIWRQRSINSKDQMFASDKICSDVRTLFINEKNIGILLCGEIFNERMRESLISKGIKIVIDIAHISTGFRVHAAMKVLAKNDVISFCSVHTQRRNGRKYCYVPYQNSWINRSSNEADFFIGKDPRLEIKIWETNKMLHNI